MGSRPAPSALMGSGMTSTFPFLLRLLAYKSTNGVSPWESVNHSSQTDNLPCRQ